MKYIISKYQYNLLKEETDEIIRIPSLKIFNNDWNSLQKYLKRRGYPKYIIEDDVTINNKDGIISLGNLVGVEGYLNLHFSKKLVSLGNLVRVGGYFDLHGCNNIKSLGDLEYVGGYLDVVLSKVSSLGKLKYIGGRLYGDGSNLESLGDLEYVGGSLDLENSKIESFGKLKYIGGPNIYLNNTPLSKKISYEEMRSKFPNI